MQPWLIKFFRSPREIGSVAPSSSYLVKLMTSHLKPGTKILELGPGSGVFTQSVIQKIQNPQNLVCIEWDPDFAEICRRRFPGATIHTGDAEAVLASDNQTYDHIISGIPFAGMKSDKRAHLFRLIYNHLATGGSFTMFQYSLITKKELQTLFGNIKIQFTPWNIPPAFIFTVLKQQINRQ